MEARRLSTNRNEKDVKEQPYMIIWTSFVRATGADCPCQVTVAILRHLYRPIIEFNL